jgi:tripartite ATP-independent transporter DctP family solute receptor
MKGIIIRIFTIAMIAIVLAGCGGGSGSMPSSPASAQSPEKTYKPVFGSQMVPGTAMFICMEWIIDQMKEKTGGRFSGTLSHSGQLGSQREIIEATNAGVIEVTSADSGTMLTYNIPECAILGLPYLFDSVEHFRKTRHVFVPMIAKALEEKTNMIILFHSTSGFRNCYLKKPVRTFADMKGMKIRTPENEGIVNAIRAMGANPTPIPSNEMYSAIQTGVVDGMENNNEAIVNFKIYEVIKYAVITQHYFNDMILLGNKKFVESIDADDKKLFLEICDKAGDNFADIRVSTDADYKKQLRDNGIEFIEPDLTDFRDAVQSLWNETIASIPAAKPVIDGIMALR